MPCTILIAENEVVVRNVARLLLEREDHFVLVASDGADALALSNQYTGEIALLLTALYLPDMDSLNLAAGIRLQRPEIRVLVMAGMSTYQGLTQLPFLRKPFSPTAFRDKIREVLRKPCADN